MKENSVNRMKKALDLPYEIIGVKFVYYKQEYNELEIAQLEKKLSVCGMARYAMDGNVFKAKADNFGCFYGGYAVGALRPGNDVLCGRSMNSIGLYETPAIDREVIEGMKYLQQEIYGLVMGPLTELDSADVVMTIGTAYQMMRIMQGYAYHNGIPHNLCSIGNQAMCSDLIAKPFKNNDINISFMCKGARLFTRCMDGEMGVAVPVNLVDSLADGVVMTINPVLDPPHKAALLARLDSPDELGVEIDPSWTYSTRLRQYMAWVDGMEKDE